MVWEGVAASAAMSLGKDGVKALAEALRAHKVKAFPSKDEYVAQRGLKSDPEFKAYCDIIKDRGYREACLLGMRLRQLQGRDEEIQRLKEFARKKRGPEKVWIAQAVEVGALNRLILLLRENGYSADEQARQVDEFLRKITRRLLLVTTEAAAKYWADVAVSRLRENPIIFCIAGSGHAEPLARKVLNEVRPSAFNHKFEVLDEAHRITGFFILLAPGEKLRPERPLDGGATDRKKAKVRRR